MSSFPDEFLGLIIAYSGLFSKPVFAHARLLLAGAILAPGKHTVTAVLRVLGLSGETKFHKYHRVLSLARWCALKGARILLGQQDKEERHLKRLCAQQPLALCQVQRSSLDKPDAALARGLGRAGVGPAFSDGAGSERALCR